MAWVGMAALKKVLLIIIDDVTHVGSSRMFSEVRHTEKSIPSMYMNGRFETGHVNHQTLTKLSKTNSD